MILARYLFLVFVKVVEKGKKEKVVVTETHGGSCCLLHFPAVIEEDG